MPDVAENPSLVAQAASQETMVTAPQQELNHQWRVMYLGNLQAECQLAHVDEKINEYNIQLKLLDMDQGTFNPRFEVISNG